MFSSSLESVLLAVCGLVSVSYFIDRFQLLSFYCAKLLQHAKPVLSITLLHYLIC